jgi:catechol 2,3-dioxygenase
MDRNKIDEIGLNSEWANMIRSMARPVGTPFAINKLGHAAINVTDLARSVEFYTQGLGFEVSDVYPDTMMPGGMVFLRFNADHHGIALVGGANGPSEARELHHMAFEVSSLDEVVRARDHLRRHGVAIDFEGRRRAGCQIAIEFRDPDGYPLEIYWGLDQIGSDGLARPSDEWRSAQSLAEAISSAPRGQDTSLRDTALRP